MSDRMLQGSLFLAVLRQGLPLALGMASHALFNLVDLLLVGRLGEDAVAGVHVATTVNFLPMILGNGISVAAISILSRLLGAGDQDRARTFSSRSQWLMIWAGVVLGVLGAALAAPCVDLQGVEGRARDLGIEYLVVTSLGTVTMFVVMQTTATMRALGEAWMPLALLVGSNVLNLLLDLVLLFGWPAMGIPALGAVGAAWATVIARALAAGLGLWWLRRPAYPLRLGRAPLREAPRGEWRELVSLGLPQSIQMLVRASAVLALTRVAAELGGPSAVTALGVTTRLDTMILFAAAGFASSATAVVGRNAGAGQFERARRAAIHGGVQAAVFAALLVALFAWFARPLMAAFVADSSEAVLTAGVVYLGVAALGHPFASFCIGVTGGVNGAGVVRGPMVIDAIGYLGLLLPGVLGVLWVAPSGGLVTAWWVFAGANALLAAAFAAYASRGTWPRGP